jgi:hypothetical protein
MSTPTPPLHASLLHAPAAASERRPERRWAYPLWAMLLVSVFVLYHTSILLIWNTPGESLAKPFHRGFLETVKGYEYFRGTRNIQSWAMFAPNPNRTNVFVRTFVELPNGEVWDFQQDIWEQDRYPYIWYDRRGKVNRNIDGKRNLQRMYGAWVCREWERTHGGEAPKAVFFVKRVTRVPPAREVIKRGGWDQWNAPYKDVDEERVTCKTAIHGTLPNELRERYGLPLLEDERAFRKVNIQTWWDTAERERKREAAKAATLERKGKPHNEPEPSGEEDSPDQ